VATVRYWAGAKAAAGRAEQTVEAGTLGELLAAIRSGGPLDRVLEASSLLVDGTAVRRDDATRPLPANAVVDVLPPFSGG
jgi:molybdopterin synthase sulfur carrier subunit